MRARWGALLGATPGLLAIATALAAQTLPVPTLPAPETAEPAPAQPAERRARPRPWEYATGIGIRWDRNIEFRIPQGPSGVAIVPRGALARVFRGPRGQLRVEAAGRWIGYPDQKERRRGYADFGLDGSYRSSPDTTWRASASFALGHTDSSQPLLDQGVVLPLVKTRTLTGALGVSRQMGTRTSLRIDGRIYRTDFDTPDLFDGRSVRGTIGLEHRLGPKDTAAMVYSLEDVLAPRAGASYLTHFGSLQWIRVLSPRTAVLLEAGGSYTPEAARARLDRKESFFGGAGFTRQGRRSSLTAFVRREVAPAFGSGLSRLAVRAGLSAALSMGPNWGLRMSAAHVRPDRPADAALAYPSGDEASAAVGRRLGRRVEISGEASYRRRGATSALPAIEALQAGVFLNLITPSGGASPPVTGR